MLRLRKFLRGCFGYLALLFLLISTSTIPSLFHPFHEHRAAQLAIDTDLPLELLHILLGVFQKLVLVMPLALGILYAIAWWTFSHGQRSARRWAIASSMAALLQGIPVCIGIYYSWIDSPQGPWLTISVVGAILLALGIGGLIAFLPRNAMAQIPMEAAKPPRIAGDGTSHLLDGAVWLLQMGGYAGGMALWYRWGQSRRLTMTHGAMYWLEVVVAILLTTVVHELGHAIVGQSLGMKLRAFVVGPFQWRIRDGRWTFQFVFSSFFSAGGAAALVPINPHQSRWKEVAMIAAGPVSGLWVGVIALFAALMAPGIPYEHAWELFALISTFGLVSSAANLIPIRPDALYSDGARILQILRGGALADLYHVFNVTASTVVTPLRPRDFDIEAIERATSSFPNGRHGLILRLIASNYFLDCGKISQAADAFSEAESIYRESALDIPGELHTIFVFDNAFLRHDAKGARIWWDRMQAKKPSHLSVDYWLAQSALEWIEGHAQDARETWIKGNALAQKLPATGTHEFDRYRFALFGEALDSSPAAS
jgi:hypothetical protein